MSRGARGFPGALARLRTPGLMAALMVATTLAAGSPAHADPAASLTSLTLPPVAYSHADRTTSGTAKLTATDDGSAGLGWHVTVESSDLAYSGGYSGADIPAANLAVTDVEAPTRTSGQAVDPTGGPKVPATSPLGSLDSPRKLLQAQPTYGDGSYEGEVELTLTVPGSAARGTYTATLTTTIATGP